MAETETSNSQGASKVTEEKISTIQQMKQVYESLLKHEKIHLFGPAGVGKTRMAKKVSDRAKLSDRAKESDRDKLFSFTLWVFMCREYTLDSLTMSIARQLSLISLNDEWEAEDDQGPNTTQMREKQQHKEQEHDRVDQAPTTTQLCEKIMEEFKGKNVLVILDDVLHDKNTKTSNETKFWSVWEEMLSVKDTETSSNDLDAVVHDKNTKSSNDLDAVVLDKNTKTSNEDLKGNIKSILISRLKRVDDRDYSDENSFEVKPLHKELSISLLKEKLDSFGFSGDTEVHNLGKRFIETFNGDLPGNVIMIAKVLNYFCHGVSGVSDLKKELEEASENKFRLSKLLFKDDVLPIGVFKDLCWNGHHFFRESGSVHFSELITYWILEGYLGVGSMSKLYKKGHEVVMELIDCGVLKVQEGGHVFMDKSLIDDHDLYHDIDRNPSLGLATMITSEAEGLGRVTHKEGMLKTTPTKRNKKECVQSDDCGQDLSTLLLDGTYATEQVITHFLETEKKLQVFGLFHPTITSLPKALETIDGLRVLVLRGCEFLTNARLNLKSLEVLEISGARNLRRLTSGLFKNMLNLKSLHISGLQIKSLPQAIYNLEKIQWLVVKDCPRLEKLESISKLNKLIVVDLSGNTSLDTLDKNFLKFDKLQSLNISRTKLSTTPLLKNRRELTHLFCSECPELVRLRGLTSLTSLETIDLSNSKDFEEFHDSSLESLSSLITLNLSGTRIDRLPSNISKPRYLYLKNCLMLQRLPHITSLSVNLEDLDLSGSSNLNQIDEKFFDEMNRLRVLNLSKTNISHLPPLSNLSNLRELDLSHCRSLVDLPPLESATKLENLDASNCIALEEIQSKSFKAMTRLQKIDFSETKIKSLPPLPNPCNALQKLLLKNCDTLQNLELNGQFPNLEELNLSGIKSLKENGAEFIKDTSSLRILDLSNTSIRQLPSMSKLINLTHLSLAGCSFSSEPELDVNPLVKIEVLDLSGSTIKSLPKLDYTNLRKLLLKDCSIKEIPNISTFTRLVYIEYPDIKVESSQEEVNQDQWNISELSHIDKPPVFLPSSQFLKQNPLQNVPYHVCAIPVMVEGKSWDTYLPRHELVFRDVYLNTSQFARYKQNKSLQLRGFNQFPKGMEKIIKDINMVFLIDYKPNGFPSDFDPSMFNNLKGCWIERCNEMVTIFTEGKNSPGFGIPLEDLGICNNIGLKSIYDGKQAVGSFDSLKSLYINGCPELTNVFSSSWLPKNLQVLKIKYCDKMVEFGGELPASLQTLKIWECPKVKQLEGQFEIPKGLKTLWISGANSLKNLVTKNKAIDLETLKVENCGMIEYIIQETYCSNLMKAHLENLPMLKQIGSYAPYLRTSEDLIVIECPKFKHKIID